MKILFVLDDPDSHAGALNHFVKCIQEAHRAGYETLAITFNRTNHNSKISETALAGLRIRFVNTDRDGTLFTDISKDFALLVETLQAENFYPQAIEFFDDLTFSQLVLQYKLISLYISNKTRIILNFSIANLPEVFNLGNKYALPVYFHLTKFNFLLKNVDDVYCFNNTIADSLKEINASSTVKLIASDEHISQKYDDLLRGPSNVHPKFYPITARDCKTFTVSAAEPLLSVVIPYYNMGQYIDETVESVFKSTYANLEVIIVNDGSTDTRSIHLLETLGRNSRIKVINQSNAGVAAARNNGIKSSQGEIIALLDADDIVEPSYYKKAVKILRDFDNISFVGCWTELFDESGIIDRWITYNPELPLYFLMNTFNSQGVVAKKDALLNFGLHDSELKMILDDWESVISMMVNGAHGIVIPEFLFKYRIRRNSVMRTHHNRWTKSYERIIEKHFNKINEYTKDLLLLLNTNGPNIFYKDPSAATDFYTMMNTTPNYRIRNGTLTRLINKYYNFVELDPLGIKIRNTFGKINK